MQILTKIILNMVACAAFVLGLLPAALSAQDVDCTTLSDLSCISSTQCMFTANFECVAPRGRCQIGFSQAILTESGTRIDDTQYQATVDQCQSQTGCSHVPAAQCYCPPDVNCFCGGGEPPNCLPTPASMLNPPTGEYIVVDARAASDVASQAGTGETEDIIGMSVQLTGDGISMDGLECDIWEIRAVDAPVNINDPLLTDVMTGPAEGDASDGDSRMLKGWGYACEGEEVVDLLQADPRVIVMPWANSSVNLILERPLTSEKITRIQLALRSLSNLAQEPTGVLDEATLTAIALLAEYRNAEKDPYRFARTAITENLFDGLDVFR